MNNFEEREKTISAEYSKLQEEQKSLPALISAARASLAQASSDKHAGAFEALNELQARKDVVDSRIIELRAALAKCRWEAAEAELSAFKPEFERSAAFLADTQSYHDELKQRLADEIRHAEAALAQAAERLDRAQTEFNEVEKHFKQKAAAVTESRARFSGLVVS